MIEGGQTWDTCPGPEVRDDRLMREAQNIMLGILKWVGRRPRVRRIRRWVHLNYRLLRWRLKGSPIPPPHELKQAVVRSYGRRFDLKTLVETGTFLGEMVAAMKDDFAAITSIELDEGLFRRARERFAGDAHVSILLGDSAKVLAEVVAAVESESLFWLDAHYSCGITARGATETPILYELASILSKDARGQVILIDDAREFTGAGDYPALDDIRKFVLSTRPDMVLEVRDDIIRIHEKRRPSEVLGHTRGVECSDVRVRRCRSPECSIKILSVGTS